MVLGGRVFVSFCGNKGGEDDVFGFLFQLFQDLGLRD